MNLRALAILPWILFLSACGGGGSDSGDDPPPPPFPDGLGPSGQIASAVPVSNGLEIVAPAISLDDSNRAIILWSDATDFLPSADDNPPVVFYAARGDAGGNWSAPELLLSLPYSPDVAITPELRTNLQGQAVANFGTGLLRFDPASGWFAIPSLALEAGQWLRFGGNADPLLADGTLPVAVSGSLTNRSTVKVYTQRGVEDFLLRYETEVIENVGARSVAIKSVASQNRADLFFSSAAAEFPGQDFHVDFLDLQGNDRLSSTPSTFALAAMGDCGASQFGSSESQVRVAALTVQSDTGCDLVLDRFGTSVIVPEQRVTADGFGLGFAPLQTTPFIAADSRGNSLAIWIERQNGSTADVASRVMWSQSVGGQWSTPQPLLDEAAGFGRATTFKVAMNRNGQAAAVVATIQSARLYLITARFSFEAGWSDLRRFAQQLGTRGPAFDVAINSDGTALAAYRQAPCTRSPLIGDGVNTSGCGADMIYALRF